jgi:Flp pilus assembly pilin Flp
LQKNAPNVTSLADQSPIDGFAGDANGSAAVECGVIVGVIALIVVLGALILDQDISTLLNDIGIFLGRIIPLPG